jgi:hypothetical protein
MLEAFERAAKPIAEKATDAHRVATGCQIRLAELCGEDGDGGRVGRMESDLERTQELARNNELALRDVRKLIAWASGKGATLGGGAVAGLVIGGIEIVRAVNGG